MKAPGFVVRIKFHNTQFVNLLLYLDMEPQPEQTQFLDYLSVHLGTFNFDSPKFTVFDDV